MSKTVTFGEILFRFLEKDTPAMERGEDIEGSFGGSEANVAVSLTRLGDKVAYVTRLPEEKLTDDCVRMLNGYGIDTSGIIKGGTRFGKYSVGDVSGPGRGNVKYYRAGSSFATSEPGMFPWKDILADAGVFHCSGIAGALSESAREATFEAVRAAKEMGLRISFDINYRKKLWAYPGADAHNTTHALMQYSDFIFGDQDEWEFATGIKQVPMDSLAPDSKLDMDRYREYFGHMHSQFPGCRDMMLGLRNQISTTHHVLTALLWHDGTILGTRIWDITGIKDPVGVGDAFVAGFIHATSKWPFAPQKCLDFSTAAAMLKNFVPGDFNLTTESEILARL